MEARTVNNLPPAASDDETVRCLLAIEFEQEELDRRSEHAVVRQGQPPHVASL